MRGPRLSQQKMLHSKRSSDRISNIRKVAIYRVMIRRYMLFHPRRGKRAQYMTCTKGSCESGTNLDYYSKLVRYTSEKRVINTRL